MRFVDGKPGVVAVGLTTPDGERAIP
jgi:hypothetical protein